MRAHDRGWIEALIDGEGSFHVRLQIHSGRYQVFRPILQIVNTNLSLVKEARRIIGYGAINKKKPASPRHAQAYKLTVVSRGLRAFLPQIKLIGKEQQRVLILQILSITNFKTYGGHPNPNGKYLPNLAKRVKFYNNK